MDRNNSNTNAEDLAKYVSEERYGTIDSEVLEHAKHLILDSLGVTIGASQLTQGESMIEFWADQGGRSDASVPTIDSKLPAMQAAYVNGYLANLLNYDDTYSNKAIGHLGATIIPATMAIAETEDVNGEAFLEGLVAGYEVSIRIGDAIAPSSERVENVLGMSTWHIFGAAVTTAKLLGLDRDEITNALGLAGVTAPVPSVRKMGLEDDKIHWLKNNFGWASMGGVKAGLLAARGFEGNETLFEGNNGFWKMASSDRFDDVQLLNELGERYYIQDVSIKPYPAGRWTHAALDSVAELADNITELTAIKRITVETFSEVTTEDTYPGSQLDAPLSLPYLISVQLHGYDVGFEWLSQEQIADESVQALAETVRIIEDESMTERYQENGQISARVEITLANGTEFEATTYDPRGGTEAPLEPSEIRAKYETLTEPVLGSGSASELADRVLSLETESSVQEVGELIAGG